MIYEFTRTIEIRYVVAVPDMVVAKGADAVEEWASGPGNRACWGAESSENDETWSWQEIPTTEEK